MQITYDTRATVEFDDVTGAITKVSVNLPYDSQGTYHDCPEILVDGVEPDEFDYVELWNTNAPMIEEELGGEAPTVPVAFQRP
jgi:hypothetical protein